MFAVTPEGIQESQRINKADPNDAQVLAHLEDVANAVHETMRDQYMDLMQDDDDDDDDASKAATGPVSRTLAGQYGAVTWKTTGVEQINMQIPAAPRRFSA